MLKRSEKLPIQKYSSTTKGYINSKLVSWQLPLYKRTNNLSIIQRSIFYKKIEQKGGFVSRPTIREKNNKRTLLLGHFKRRVSLSLSLSLSLSSLKNTQKFNLIIFLSHFFYTDPSPTENKVCLVLTVFPNPTFQKGGPLGQPGRHPDLFGAKKGQVMNRKTNEVNGKGYNSNIISFETKIGLWRRDHV